MKKCLSIVMSFMMLIGMMSVGNFSYASAYNMGDVNRDGVINTADVRYVLLGIVADTAFTSAEKALADMNGSGDITTADVRIILEYIVNGTQTEPVPDDVEIIDLLAPAAEEWYNPTETISNADVAVTQTALSDGGYRFTNIGGSWPHTSYVYERKILVPKSAVIEYDITINSASASINLYLGGAVPEVGENSSMEFKLNSLISDNIDSGSGDILKGNYQGSVSLSNVSFGAAAYDGDLIRISGIKLYVVGASDSSVTIRKLTVTGYDKGALTFPDSSDAYAAVRSRLMESSELGGFPDLTAIKFYQNGTLTNTSSYNYYGDNKKIYQSNLKQRAVEYADGYMIDLPLGFEPDYRLSELRTRYKTDTAVLTISKEEESTYADTEAGWNTYFNEWIRTYLVSERFLEANNISVMRGETISETTVSGHTVYTYDFMIEEMGADLEMPYYSIAVIRKFYDYNTFYLMVYKSAVPTTQLFDAIVKSFTPISVYGKAVSWQGQFDKIIPESWSQETKDYYNQLCSQSQTDFGFFTHSMVSSKDNTYASQDSLIAENYDRISHAVGYDYGIMPTYTHLKWYDTYNHFPLEMANKYAGGNGFNGKPVLQFTYQFTVNNNSDLHSVNPSFDILRGVHDDHFRKLAQDIKTYGKPILFRLNNEMNTDWTSYCGMTSLLDPDIFVMTWKHLYRIFEEEGVNNCIWIFNPFDRTYPYCSWGEDICYMPGSEYVQILGITGYVTGNSSSPESFQSVYTKIYNKSNPNFGNLPWVISEFGCGAGGEKEYDYDYDVYNDTTLGRNAYAQSQWVTSMFYYLNNKNYYAFCKNIKGAVWFSVNDYCYINNAPYIVNYFSLDGTSSYTLSAFKKGFASY